jgi:hypothetical protein
MPEGMFLTCPRAWTQGTKAVALALRVKPERSRVEHGHLPVSMQTMGPASQASLPCWVPRIVIAPVAGTAQRPSVIMDCRD